MATVEILGLHPVTAPEPCYLVELMVRGSSGRFDLSLITQPVSGKPRSEWQVPYGEKILDRRGEAVVWDLWQGPGEEGIWTGDVRLAFFFHYLDLGSPLRTPFGDVALPAPADRPTRLSDLGYEEP
jgi:hypothetical protein